ncbi:hypothetical protein JP35_09775 [Gallibacterium anatis]|uniref:hypothetical protein n=1 Tax=Gallibacterium anatis TaxID=750 RepID=UPI0005313888|nr:hypothetical protein [Gallibacterium anatis]KGQ37205.1 hypothetical protein JP35_09775 [Gallibacterium anatis]
MTRNQDNLILQWKEVYRNIHNVKLYNPFNESENIREKIKDINFCFYKIIISQLNDKAINEIRKLLIQTKKIYEKHTAQKIQVSYENTNKSTKKSWFEKIIDCITLKNTKEKILTKPQFETELLIDNTENVESFTTLINKIRNSFDIVQNIDIYIDTCKSITKSGESALQAIQNDYDERLKVLLGKHNELSLFSAYQEQANKINCRIKLNTLLFFFIITILLIIAYNSMTNLEYNPSINWIPYISFRIFIAFTAFYALVFLNRSIRDDRKLEQTYRHKEVVSKSYLNYLDFLDANPMIITNDKGEHIDNSQLIKEKVSQIAVESLGLNPALLLDKSTSEKIPMEELLSKILDRTTADKKG